MAPSRLKSDFCLDLRFDPPDRAEEEAIRRMVHWLRQIPIVTAGTGSPPASPPLEVDPGEILDAIRHAARDAFASPPEAPAASPPDIFVEPPPAFLGIPAGQECEVWSAVFR